MHNLKNLLICLVLASSAAYADECNLAPNVNSVIDLRDGGIGFGYGTRAILADSSAPLGTRCKTILRATNLAEPRSRIYQELVSPSWLTSYEEEINISDITLRGQGALKFMSVNFEALQGNVAQTNILDLFITPGPIPKGSEQASTYVLTAHWAVYDTNGTPTSHYVSSPTIEARGSNQVALKWDVYRAGLQDGMKLKMVFNNGYELPISEYPTPGAPVGTIYGQQSFYPTTKTIGSLAQTNLEAQTSFVLDAISNCIRSPGAPNQGSCD